MNEVLETQSVFRMVKPMDWFIMISVTFISGIYQ